MQVAAAELERQEAYSAAEVAADVHHKPSTNTHDEEEDEDDTDDDDDLDEEEVEELEAGAHADEDSNDAADHHSDGDSDVENEAEDEGDGDDDDNSDDDAYDEADDAGSEEEDGAAVNEEDDFDKELSRMIKVPILVVFAHSVKQCYVPTCVNECRIPWRREEDIKFPHGLRSTCCLYPRLLRSCRQ